MPCDAPFFPHATNFADNDEHDRNARKFWFLVLGVGLFTKKTEADQHCDPDDVLIFFTKEQARRRWGAYCRKRHTHDDFDVPDSEEDDGSEDNSIDNLAPTPRPAPPRSASVKLNKPASRTASAKPSRPANPSTPAKRPISTKPPVSVKREGVSVKREVKQVMLPLFMDDSPPTRARGRTSASIASSPSASPGRSPGPSPTPPPAISPSVSSVSSISTASSVATHQGRRAPRTVASSAGAAPAHTSLPPNAAASASHAKSTARPTLHHFGGGSSTGGSSASESSSVRLLYNSSTRKIYKDAEKAVKEMGLEDTVQVVDCEELVGYCAGKAGKMGE